MYNPYAHLQRYPMSQLLRQATIVSSQVAQQVQAYYASLDEQQDRDMLYRLPSSMIDTESSAVVVPVTVMFTDLRDFTTLVEEYPPNQVVRQLNEYFSSMTRIIVEHGGVLDKYMGDEIMAYFEPTNPLEYGKVARQSVLAAVEMIDTLAKLNKRWEAKGWPVLKCGIGINSGPVLKGNIGSMVKLETTIIGDTVNVASRLQQLNKDYNAHLLISASTYKLIPSDLPVRSLGDINIRGKRNTVEVYEVDVKTLLQQ